MAFSLSFVAGRVLKGDGKLLKHLHVVSAKSFVVEVLPSPESLPDEALVLWLQHRHPNPAVVGGGGGQATSGATDSSAHGVWMVFGLFVCV